MPRSDAPVERRAPAGPRPHIVLVGMMGSGKSTLGRLLAERLGRPFVDADSEIERRARRTIRTIFEQDGETAFRRIESAVLNDVLDVESPSVIAAGGGAVLADKNRTALAARATTVWLRATPATLVARVAPAGRANVRPLLDGDPAARIERLVAERQPFYEAAADLTVDVDDLAPPELACHIAERVQARMASVTVTTSTRTYRVLVGRGARRELAACVPARAKRVAVVTQASIPFTVDSGREYKVFTIGDGEQHKRLSSVETLCRDFAVWGMSRADCVVAVGGGIVTDVAGFAAATYLRGIDIVNVPTTLLGMVDAAIGGKTGVNLPVGKNLVGAFWQPAAVICDLDALDTLPERERRCGLGEMAKYHFLTGDDLLSLDLVDRVARCVEIKAAVVGADERESIASDNRRGRATLNYGHTLAHALEIAGEHDLRHGEAVAIGLMFAAHLAHVMGRIDADRVAEHRHVVGDAYGLDVTLPAGADRDALIALMARDKKAIDGLTFVLDGADGVEVVNGVPRDAVDAAFESMTFGERRGEMEPTTCSPRTEGERSEPKEID